MGTQLKNTKHQKGYIVINKSDIETLGLDWETVTAKDLNDFARNKLSLPKREKVSQLKEEIESLKAILKLDEKTSTKEVLAILRKKAKV